jgi:hypothetical protein
LIFQEITSSRKISKALKNDTKRKKLFTLLYENRQPDDAKTMLWFPLSAEDKVGGQLKI